MPRRIGLPGASELFRPTGPGDAPPDAPARPAASPAPPEPPPAGEQSAVAPPTPTLRAPAVEDVAPAPTGRVRHDEKITVYVSSEELLALEQVRLTLRAHHGVAVDRGRIVRAAIADALADLAENGAASALVMRLTEP